MFPKTQPIGMPISWHTKHKTVREQVQERKFQEEQYQFKQRSVLAVDVKFGPIKVEESPSGMSKDDILDVTRRPITDDLTFAYDQYTDPPGMYDVDRGRGEVTTSPSALFVVEFDGISD
ncbi:hypothetical protein EC973_004158 [Apophysomyces ossiformis]|uniref:Uncharacterized protein n=1 Tax=Apophysomyces ossiformis TaxID=679940 RepID=A0A8H7BGA0_9FUNG|nr:hypothetical protein EC973_004158 [Apophysomyces ossiformis]